MCFRFVGNKEQLYALIDAETEILIYSFFKKILYLPGLAMAIKCDETEVYYHVVKLLVGPQLPNRNNGDPTRLQAALEPAPAGEDCC